MLVKGKTLFNLFFVSIFAIGFYFSLGWGIKARLFPQLIVISGLVIAVFNLIKEIAADRLQSTAEDKPAETEEEKIIRESSHEITPRNEAIMAMWVVIFFCMIILLGFWISIVVYTALFMSMFGRENWKMIATYTICIWLSIYITFAVGMKTSLYGGIFGLAW